VSPSFFGDSNEDHDEEEEKGAGKFIAKDGGKALPLLKGPGKPRSSCASLCRPS